MTIWISKYWATKGVYPLHNAEEYETAISLYYTVPGHYSSEFYRAEKEAFRSEQDAREHAASLAKAKVERLKKQIAKIKEKWL